MERIPVIIFSGFLGAGKTTAINALIQAHPEVPFYLVENEYGEISIDGALLNQPLIEKVELSGGCICCSLDLSFRKTLMALSERVVPGGIVIIETTGLADPGNIKKAILTDPVLQGLFVLQSVITLCNTRQIIELTSEESEIRSLAARQLACADLILLSRADLQCKEEVESVVEKVKVWQSLAEIYPVYSGKIPLDILSWKPGVNSLPTFRLNPALALSEIKPALQSECWKYAEPFDLMAFIHRMNVMLKIQGKDIYRTKGWINVKEESRRFFFQSVGDAFMVSSGPEWKEEEAPETCIVFIGKYLNRDVLDKNFRACFYK